MSHSSVLVLEIGAPVLALVCLLALAWARRQRGQVLWQAASLKRRLETELGDLQAQGERVRLRIALAAELYCAPPKRGEMTQGCNELLAFAESLEVELFEQVNRLPRLRGQELREAHVGIVALGNEVRQLARSMEDLDRLWTKKLDSMMGERPSAAPKTRPSKSALA